MSQPHSVTGALQPADYEDMRAQARGLEDRAAQAGLSHIAYALEVVVMLLDEAETKSGQQRRPDA
jgi:hypothetical protein